MYEFMVQATNDTWKHPVSYSDKNNTQLYV